MMRQLTNDEIQKELKGFPRQEMNDKQAETILAALSSSQVSEPPRKKPLPALLSFVVLAFLFAGITVFTINNIVGQERNGASIEEKMTIDPMGKFTVRAVSKNKVDFFQGEKKVGGIEILTKEEMDENIRKQHVFENSDLHGFKYPVKWTLDHQKTMEAVQINHFFFLSKKSGLRYHIYFFTPYIDSQDAHKIARTFRYDE